MNLSTSGFAFSPINKDDRLLYNLQLWLQYTTKIKDANVNLKRGRSLNYCYFFHILGVTVTQNDSYFFFLFFFLIFSSL